MAIMRWNKEDHYDPWYDLKELQDDINSLFEPVKNQNAAGLFDRTVSPPIDVVEDDHGYEVSCELPGLEQKDIDITLASNVLTIKGTKKDEKDVSEKNFFRKESWSGTFQRTLSLPVSVDADKINATLKHGILNIAIPKKEEAKPKQIAVKVKEEDCDE